MRRLIVAGGQQSPVLSLSMEAPLTVYRRHQGAIDTESVETKSYNQLLHALFSVYEGMQSNARLE